MPSYLHQLQSSSTLPHKPKTPNNSSISSDGCPSYRLNYDLILIIKNTFHLSKLNVGSLLMFIGKKIEKGVI